MGSLIFGNILAATVFGYYSQITYIYAMVISACVAATLSFFMQKPLPHQSDD
jgi:hypothetical protein